MKLTVPCLFGLEALVAEHQLDAEGFYEELV